jgi:hypothetical protein
MCTWRALAEWGHVAVVGFTLVAAVFDLREVFHQIDQSRAGLAVSGVALLHLPAAAPAALFLRSAGLLFHMPAT